MDIGTYGLSPAARNLTQILNAIGDDKLNHLVSKEIQKSQKLIVETLMIDNRDFAVHVLILIRESRLRYIDTLQKRMDRNVFTHMRTTTVTNFKNALSKILEQAIEV